MVEKECRRRQQEVDDAYREELSRLEVEVRRRDADVMEGMADHLRWWVENWFRKVGHLPTFPEGNPVELTHLLGLPKGESEKSC